MSFDGWLGSRAYSVEAEVNFLWPGVHAMRKTLNPRGREIAQSEA